MLVLKRLAAGAVIGVANIIPGVSGATMAVILGVYDEIIEAISHFFSSFKKHASFLLAIGLGAVGGVVLFSRLVKYALEQAPLATNFLFVGLIVGSVPLLYSYAFSEEAQNQAHNSLARQRVINVIAFSCFFLLMVALTFIPQDASQSVRTTLDAAFAARLFIAGVVACAAMIVPGISGSFMFVLFGVYLTIVTAISDFNIVLLIPVAAGAIVGLLGGAKLIDWLFKRFKQATYCAIFGLVAGSALQLFVTSAHDLGMNFATFGAALALVAGIVVAYLFGKNAQ